MTALATLYTIGHSTRTFEELAAALRAHGIEALADIRAFPRSQRMPQFNREHLEVELLRAGIGYVWIKGLGGYRKQTRPDSPHTALRNPSFRNYADYMLTDEFEAAIGELIALPERRRTAYMCAERMWFACHRMLVSDWLVAHGHSVFHILGSDPAKPHALTQEARLEEGYLVYRGGQLF